jgi:2-keto-4-pentenoate hydratase
MVDHAEIAASLAEAHATATPIDPDSLPALDIEDGYAIQAELIERRRAAAGEPTGYKIGFTSDAIREELGVDSPAYGRVLEGTLRPEGRVDTDGFVSPRIEPEIAFLLEAPLSPPASRLDVAAATRAVVPAIEIVDCRLRGWEFDPATAVADNALAAGLVYGEPRPPGAALDLEGVSLSIDGERRGGGTGAAVLGHPADAVAWLSEAVGGLDAGNLVTTGSVTETVPVAPGETALARFSSLGSVSVHFA